VDRERNKWMEPENRGEFGAGNPGVLEGGEKAEQKKQVGPSYLATTVVGLEQARKRRAWSKSSWD